MTTADRTPHPWSLNSGSTPVSPNPSTPHQSTSPTQESTAATNNRMLLDEHRSENGQCVRCQIQWPCDTAIDAMYGGAA